jgi:hypothetical protein
VEQTIHIGDAAVGSDAMTSIYDTLKDRPVVVDLQGALQQLGISEKKETIRFDDSAPLAAFRRSVTSVKAVG